MYEYKGNIDSDTIYVEIYYNGKLIKTKKLVQ